MILGLILLTLVLSMLSNCVLAWSLHTIWDWFCAASLGAGPTLAAWWGVALIASLVITCSTSNLAREKSEAGHSWQRPVALTLTCLVTLGIAWVFGTILGWRA